MDNQQYQKKYFKYKNKYLNLLLFLRNGGTYNQYVQNKNRKNMQMGGNIWKGNNLISTSENNLLYHKIADTQSIKFSLEPFLDIKETTSSIFIGNYMYVISLTGEIYYIHGNEEPKIKQIYNIKNEIHNFTSKDTEQGLLGIAHDGQYLYLSYTTEESPSSRLNVSRFHFIKNEDDVQIRFDELIWSIEAKYSYHYGGKLQINPYENDSNKPYEGSSRYLYMGTGDGGPQGDPEQHGQSLDSYKGKILRFDLLDNNKIKIIAYGLRNPWEFTFNKDGKIWIGDVGWDKVESIKLIRNESKLDNFGWNLLEGSLLNDKYNGNLQLDELTITPPVWEYPRKPNDRVCVIGGYEIDGVYIFGDLLCKISAIHYNNDKKYWERIGDDNFITKGVNDEEQLYAFSMDYLMEQIYVHTNEKVYRLHYNYN